MRSRDPNMKIGDGMGITHEPKRNQLLAALPHETRDRLLAHLIPVELPQGHVIYESGGLLDHVYFPINSIVSLLYVTAGGSSTEIGVVGNEGVVGVALFMGGSTTPSGAVVQSTGWAYRLRVDILKCEFDLGGATQHVLLRYTQALITQMAQTVVCNRYHSIDQQLCRWLLHRLDRLESNDLIMTQERIADMLGVRRPSVSEAASKLQDAGLIRYAHGHVQILDRTGLEKRVCECYRVVKRESHRLLLG